MSRRLAKGAEACLYLEDWFGYCVVRKHRLPKVYRVAQLDQTIRRNRTIHEARLLSAARHAGVSTPVVFSVDPETATIIMEYIEGPRVKELLPTLSSIKRRALFRQVGAAVARLHQFHLCHGDLTTSNLLLHPSEKVYFVDFGLASFTESIEDYGVDLHLLRRALRSTHYPYWKICFNAFKVGYSTTYGNSSEFIFRKIAAIQSRGRYVTERIR